MAQRTVSDVMTRKVVSVGPDVPVVEIVSKLRAYRISCLVVCEDEEPVGIISERDVVGVAFALLSGKPGAAEQTARDLMTSPVLSVEETAALDSATAFADEHRVRHLPVVDGSGSLVGLLTQTDLLRALL